jgi:hypothetical protein
MSLTPLGVLMALLLAPAGGSQASSNGSPFQYVSPRPGAELVLEETTIILRPGGRITSADVDIHRLLRIEGSRSGLHTYDVITAEEERTLIFKPHIPFEAGEHVSVVVGAGLKNQHGNAIAAFSYGFTISAARGTLGEDAPSMCLASERTSLPATSGLRSRSYFRDYGIVLPADFPEITITELDAPDTGYTLVSVFSDIDTAVGNYLMILDNTGSPVFFRQLFTRRAYNFKKQPNGLLSYDAGSGAVLLDSTYSEVDTFRTGNGYHTNGHDFQLLPNGNGLLMAYDAQTVDMSEIVEGGSPIATVIGLIIQEVDPNDNVLFQWRSWDHFNILDATHMNFTRLQIDYVHGNSIEQDTDGNILICCRHMDEITKINRQTGDIIWRFGGLNNQFTVTNDTLLFTYQHDCRRMANGNVTIFDNGNWHIPRFSRAVEYELDEVYMTATLVWQFRDSPDKYSSFMGNAQRLPNGNTLIGWGGNNAAPLSAALVEVRPDGSKAFEMSLPEFVVSYRAFRYPWSGTAARPELWAEGEENTVTLSFVKFGDDHVAKYYVYQGNTADIWDMFRVDSTSGNSVVVTELEFDVTHYFRVTAVDSQGHQSELSNAIAYAPVLPTGIEIAEGEIPMEGGLLRHCPNPFNATTTITFGLPETSRVTLSIHNLLGQEVRSLVRGMQPAGSRSCVWDGKDNAGRPVCSGTYFYRLEAGNSVTSRKMILLK